MRSLNAALHREPGALFAYVALVVVVALWLVRTPSLSPDTLAFTIAGRLPLVLAACGMAIVLISRGIDLSVGSMVAVANVVIARGGDLVGSPWLAALLALLLTAAIGLVNGLLIGLLELPALVVTLATGSVATGLALYISPNPGGHVPVEFSNVSITLIGPVPLALLLAFLVPLVIWYPIRRSRAGFALLAVGGDEAAAFVSGLKPWRSRALAYLLSGTFAGLAGVFLTMAASSGDAKIGAPYTLNAIAAAVLGGVALTGGRGSIAGAIGGALTLSFITNLLFSWGLNSYWQYVATGVILIAVVGVPYLLTQLRSRKAVAP